RTMGWPAGGPTAPAAVPGSGGLRGQAQASLRVRAPNTPPAVTIASPADGSSVPAGTAVRLGAAASDDFDGDLTGQIRWTSSRDGALGPNGTRVLSEGAHTLVAAVTDSDGAPGSATSRLTVTPTPPVVTIAAPADGTTIFAGTSLAFSGTAADAEDGDLGAALVWTSSRDGALGTGRAVVVPGLSVGMHALTASVADRDGATASASVTVTVVPSTLAFSPSADTYVDSGSASAKFGGATSLPVGASPGRQAFLRFAVAGIGPFRVQQALLRLTVGSSSGDGSAAGCSVRAITNSAWSEATTTYKARPAIDGAVLATRGAVTPKQVVDFDV